MFPRGMLFSEHINDIPVEFILTDSITPKSLTALRDHLELFAVTEGEVKEQGARFTFTLVEGGDPKLSNIIPFRAGPKKKAE